MFDIFVSYATKDRERVRTLAEALVEQGWSVFWDRDIFPGLDWRKAIDEALRDAAIVVVVWTDAALGSNWVLEEAEVGRKRGILVPVRLEDVELPLGFRGIQAADLDGWDGDPNSPSFQQVVRAIKEKRRRAAATDAPSPEAEAGSSPSHAAAARHEERDSSRDTITGPKPGPSQRHADRRSTKLLWSIAGLTALVLAAILLWAVPPGSPTIPVGTKVLAAWMGKPCYYPATVQGVSGSRYDVFFNFVEQRLVDRGDVIVARTPLSAEIGIGSQVYVKADERKDMWLKGVIREQRDDQYYVALNNATQCDVEQPHAWASLEQLRVEDQKSQGDRR